MVGIRARDARRRKPCQGRKGQRGGRDNGEAPVENGEATVVDRDLPVAEVSGHRLIPNLASPIVVVAQSL